MARTDRTVEEIVRAGTEPTFVAAIVDGEMFLNDGKTTFIHVNNGSGGALVVTIDTPGLVDGLAIADRTVTVPAGQRRLIGPFPPDIYNQADGKVYVDTDTQTTITISYLRLPR